MKSSVPQNDSASDAPYSRVLARPKSANLITPVSSIIVDVKDGEVCGGVVRDGEGA